MDITRLRRLTDFDEVMEPWQELAAGRPMRSWHWHATWWMHYGQPRRGAKRELMTLIVKDGGRAVAVAPWFLEHSPSRGRVLRFLGEGEVCTEYPTILFQGPDPTAAVAALADYLVAEAPAWDVLEMGGVEGDDTAVNGLVAHLAERGLCDFDRSTAFRCWKLPLPASWEDYLQMLSKSHRKQLRRLQRRVRDGAFRTHVVSDPAQFDRAWNILVDLHQRRRRGLGQPGCFASQTFESFHRSVARHLLSQGQLGLAWIELQGRPIAAEYTLIGRDATLAYQGGLDPAFLAEEPGRISTMKAIEGAIERRHTAFDFLRGDEPYKAHWRAQPVDCYVVRVVAERTTSQLREAAYQTIGCFKDWLKAGWQQVRETAPGGFVP